MKKTLVVLAFIGIVLLILLLGVLFFLRSRTTGPEKEAVTEKLVTLPVTGIAINPFQGAVDLKNVSLLNPEGFSDRVFASVPELYVDLDMATLTRPVKHIRELRLHLASVVIVRRRDGLYNFEPLLERREVRREAKEEAKERKTRFTIDRIRLQIGHITFLDYTVEGGRPLIIRFDVNMDETYTNVRDLEATGKQVARTFLDKIEIGNIQNFQIDDLPDISRSALDAIPDDTKDRIFGSGKDRDRVLKELGKRFSSKIKDIGKK